MLFSPFAPSSGGLTAPSPVQRAVNPSQRAPEPFKRAKPVGFSTAGFDAGGAGRIRIFRVNGGVSVEVQLTTKYAPLLTKPLLAPIYAVLKKMVRTAVNLSQGPLKLPVLRKMGHPYGKGQRRGLGRLTRIAGVGNIEVVNKQSGRFASKWKGELDIEFGGVTLKLMNTSKVAQYLLGTKKMRRHGPWTAAVERHMSELKREWRKLTNTLRRMVEINVSLTPIRL